MAATMRIGLLGLVHDHLWGVLPRLMEQEGVRVVAAADPNEPLLERVRSEYGVESVYTSYEHLIDGEQLDAVLVYADNSSGPSLTELAAARGLHVLVEKPMASTFEGAERMLVAARNAGVLLMVNWPTAWSPEIRHALALARAGEIGDLYSVKYRSAHGGPREFGCSPFFYDWLYDEVRNGAGAYIDYCCYGANLARYLLGLPSRVMAMAGRLVKEDIPVDDTGVLLMRYPRALAVAEGAWTQVGAEPGGGPVLYGTKGTLVFRRRGALREGGKGGGAELHLVTKDEPYGQPLDVPALPAAESSGPAYFLDCIRRQREPEGLGGARIGLDTQEILQAGLVSIQRGAEVSLPLDNRA